MWPTLSHPTYFANTPYYNSHIEPDINDEPHVYRDAGGQDNATIEGYTAQVAGGGTQLYGGVHLRFPPRDFALKSFNEGRSDLQADPNGDIQREARDWPISYADLEPYYSEVETKVGLNGTTEHQLKPFSENALQPPLDPNPISAYARAGMVALGQQYPDGEQPVQPYRTPLAVITQDHAPSGRTVPQDPSTIKSGYVNRYGDPLGLKSSTWVSLLQPIRDRDNLEVWGNCTVTYLECDGDRVHRLRCRDPSGREQALALAAHTCVVVACSGIESVRLLKLSAQADAAFAQRIDGNGLLGKYFLTHCFGGAETIVVGDSKQPQHFDKSISLDSDWTTGCFATDAFLRDRGLWAGAAVYNNTSDQALPVDLGRKHGSSDLDTVWQAFVEDTSLVGDRLVAFLDRNFGTRLSVSFMGNQLPLASSRGRNRAALLPLGGCLPDRDLGDLGAACQQGPRF